MLQHLTQEVHLRTRADPTVPRIGTIGLASAVSIAYFFAAQLSLALLAEPVGVAVFWPAAGVSSGVLIALRRDARLPVAAGAMVATIIANLMGDRNVWGATAFALCNAGEALLAAWLIERYFGPGFASAGCAMCWGCWRLQSSQLPPRGSAGRWLTSCSTARRHRFGPLGSTGLHPTPSASSLLRRWLSASSKPRASHRRATRSSKAS